MLTSCSPDLLALSATTNEIYDLAWSPDGTHLIVGCTDNVARIYDASTGAPRISRFLALAASPFLGLKS